MAVAGRQHRRQRQSRAKAGPGVVLEPSTLRNNMHENRETSAVSRNMGDRSGKAICRTPDMNAVEGSDRAVVPMKLPNKEERLASAEAVEGRARTKENVAELYTTRHRARKSVSQGLRGVREVKFRFDAIIQGKSRMR